MGTRPKRGGKKERATNKEKERRKGLQKKTQRGCAFFAWGMPIVSRPRHAKKTDRHERRAHERGDENIGKKKEDGRSDQPRAGSSGFVADLLENEKK